MAGNGSDCRFSTFESQKYGLGQAEVDCQSVLKSLRKDNLNKIVLAHLDINPIRNKFDCPSEQVKRKTDILLVSETKIVDSLPIRHFIIDGFSLRFQLPWWWLNVVY